MTPYRQVGATNKMKLLLLFTLMTITAFANDKTKVELQLKDFSIELELLTNHLNTYHQDLKSHAHDFEQINENLNGLDHANALFFLKSEVRKGLLMNQHLELAQGPSERIISPTQQKLFTQKFEQEKKELSILAQWILQSIILDIEQAQAQQDSSQKEIRLAKINQHLGPWLTLFLKQSVTEFEQTLTLIGLDIVKNITLKSALFKHHAASAQDDKVGDLFMISTPKTDASTSSKEGEKDPLPLELAPSEAVDALLNQEEMNSSEKTQDWRPR